MRLIGFLLFLVLCVGCGRSQTVAVSRGGVKEASVEIETGSDGLTTEQRNVSERLKMDNKPGTIKHLYIFSAYSGQAIIYSTVKGKVTSSGKRLSPYSVAVTSQTGVDSEAGIPFSINGRKHYTSEVIQDDGTYGSSAEYIYWWDVRGVYHQHYVSGGQIVHISNEPMPVKSIVVNIELAPGISK